MGISFSKLWELSVGTGLLSNLLDYGQKLLYGEKKNKFSWKNTLIWPYKSYKFFISSEVDSSTGIFRIGFERKMTSDNAQNQGKSVDEASSTEAAQGNEITETDPEGSSRSAAAQEKFGKKRIDETVTDPEIGNSGKEKPREAEISTEGMLQESQKKAQENPDFVKFIPYSLAASSSLFPLSVKIESSSELFAGLKWISTIEWSEMQAEDLAKIRKVKKDRENAKKEEAEEKKKEEMERAAKREREERENPTTNAKNVDKEEGSREREAGEKEI